MTDREPHRRHVLRRSAELLCVPGVALLAGCPQPDETVLDRVGELGEDGGSDSTPTAEPPPVRAEPNYEDWFDGVGNYDGGTVVIRAESDSATVTVGAEGNDENRAFEPPALAVSVGTTVEWEWTGEGGAHNVVEATGAFDSGSPVESDEETFGHEFTETGTYRYVCETHEADGMRGTVTVYDPDG